MKDPVTGDVFDSENYICQARGVVELLHSLSVKGGDGAFVEVHRDVLEFMSLGLERAVIGLQAELKEESKTPPLRSV